MGVIRGKSAGSNHAMHMRVKPELLIPCVENTEEAELSTEMRRIASNFQQCFAGAKQ